MPTTFTPQPACVHEGTLNGLMSATHHLLRS